MSESSKKSCASTCCRELSVFFVSGLVLFISLWLLGACLRHSYSMGDRYLHHRGALMVSQVSRQSNSSEGAADQALATGSADQELMGIQASWPGMPEEQMLRKLPMVGIFLLLIVAVSAIVFFRSAFHLADRLCGKSQDE